MENNLQEPTPHSQNKHAKPAVRPPASKVALTVALIVILVAAIAGGVFYVQKKSADKDSTTGNPITEEGRMALESQIAALETQASSLPDDVPAADRFQVYYKLAEAKHLLGRNKEALDELDKVADANQDNPSLHSLYASIYRSLEDMDKAKESAKRTVELDPTSPQAWVMHITLQEDAGQDALKGIYAEALEKTNNNVGVVTAYAQFLEKIGDREGAIAQWQKAGEVFPQGKAEYDGEIARLQQQQ